MTELIDKPAEGKPAIVPAGDAVIDLLHVEDAARATLLAADAPPSKAIALNIGGFRASLRQAAAIVRSVLPDSHITVEDGSWNGIDHHYDISAAEEAIGYIPRIGLEEGLLENISQIRRRLST
jgi:UDP-glucose 4-epimerase